MGDDLMLQHRCREKVESEESLSGCVEWLSTSNVATIKDLKETGWHTNS